MVWRAVKRFLLTTTIFGLGMSPLVLVTVACGLLTRADLSRAAQETFSLVLAGALLFGLAMAVMDARYYSEGGKGRMALTLESGERVIRSGPAAFYEGSSPGLFANKGWLYLTNQRLVYLTWMIFVPPMDMAIPLAAVEGAETFRTRKLFHNGLCVRTERGDVHFVVEQVGIWRAALAAPGQRDS